MKNLQALVTEILYKGQNNCSSEIINKVFPINKTIYEYDLINTSDFAARRIKTVRYGLESSSYLGPRLLNILSDKYKKIQFVKNINAKIRSWCLKTAPLSCGKYIFNMYVLFRDRRQI